MLWSVMRHASIWVVQVSTWRWPRTAYQHIIRMLSLLLLYWRVLTRMPHTSQALRELWYVGSLRFGCLHWRNRWPGSSCCASNTQFVIVCSSYAPTRAWTLRRRDWARVCCVTSGNINKYITADYAISCACLTAIIETIFLHSSYVKYSLHRVCNYIEITLHKSTTFEFGSAMHSTCRNQFV